MKKSISTQASGRKQNRKLLRHVPRFLAGYVTMKMTRTGKRRRKNVPRH